MELNAIDETILSSGYEMRNDKKIKEMSNMHLPLCTFKQRRLLIFNL